ncbi:DUF1129 family protein [Oceanobacillus manasiensis]|uniref:DUF1129 family protein n=1 Tax=Oceanobacillus manasiensis TaxID=586413 RepID=UPI0005A7C652|nr:DUF1129 family protein [Oceanobacillus manasiensis]
MEATEIIELNNEKRTRLTEHNLKYYEDMLLYIRLNGNKSEQQTEEVLLEMLEHLLQAQQEGKTAEEVFGSDPKAYCKEVIKEIPKEEQKNQISLIIMIVLQFLGIFIGVTGILGTALYFFFGIGNSLTTFSIGSGIAILVIDLILLGVFIFSILKWIKRGAFSKKETKKWVEFFQVWIICTVFIGLIMLIQRFMPAFGKEVSIPTFYLAILGALLYLSSYLMRKNQTT